MATVNVYLNFNGNCEAAFNFYKSALGTEFSHLARFKDMPPQEGMPPLTAEEGEKVMHVSLPVSKETMLMGSDSIGEYCLSHQLGNNFSISINADSKEEANHLFNALSFGGQIMMPMNDTFWGSYFGMFTDQFGINWMVSFDQQPH